MARYLNNGSFEKGLKELTLEGLYLMHDFYVMAGNRERLIKIDTEILNRESNDSITVRIIGLEADNEDENES